MCRALQVDRFVIHVDGLAMCWRWEGCLKSVPWGDVPMFFSSSDSLNVVREISNVGRKDYKGSILFLVPYTKIITSRVFSPVFCCFHSDAFSIHVLRNLDYHSNVEWTTGGHFPFTCCMRKLGYYYIIPSCTSGRLCRVRLVKFIIGFVSLTVQRWPLAIAILHFGYLMPCMQCCHFNPKTLPSVSI